MVRQSRNLVRSIRKLYCIFRVCVQCKPSERCFNIWKKYPSNQKFRCNVLRIAVRLNEISILALIADRHKNLAPKNYSNIIRYGKHVFGYRFATSATSTGGCIITLCFYKILSYTSGYGEGIYHIRVFCCMLFKQFRRLPLVAKALLENSKLFLYEKNRKITKKKCIPSERSE